MNKKPNIVLITIDCLRADHCGWLNPEKRDLTPFLNKLAKESFIFTQAYTTGPNTSFAFPGILTGTYPLSFSGWDGKEFPGINQRPSLSETLQKNGYFTLAVHDNPIISAFFGYDRGFDIFRDLQSSFDISRDFQSAVNLQKVTFFSPKWWLRQLNTNKWYEFKKYLKKFPKIYNSLYFLISSIRARKISPCASAEKINEAVLEEMQFAEGRWFLWVHYMDLHEPYFPPKEMLPARISEKRLKKVNIQFRKATMFPQFQLKKEVLQIVKELYELKLRYLDHQIELLFNKLKNQFENSLILITADHGQEFGEQERVGHSRLWRETLHVPLIIKIPGQKGKIINKTVSSVQIPATILNLSGIKAPPEMQPSLFNKGEIRVCSELLLDHSSLSDKFDLATKQVICHNTN